MFSEFQRHYSRRERINASCPHEKRSVVSSVIRTNDFNFIKEINV